jgi:hypothetical protein
MAVNIFLNKLVTMYAKHYRPAINEFDCHLSDTVRASLSTLIKMLAF